MESASNENPTFLFTYCSCKGGHFKKGEGKILYIVFKICVLKFTHKKWFSPSLPEEYRTLQNQNYRSKKEKTIFV